MPTSSSNPVALAASGHPMVPGRFPGAGRIKDNTSLLHRLRWVPLLHGLSLSTLDAVIAAARVVEVGKGEVVAGPCGMGEGMFFILEGAISVEAPMPHRDVLVLDTIEAPGVLWRASVMENADIRLRHRAETAVVVAWLPCLAVRALALGDAGFALRLLDTASAGAARLMGHMVNTRSYHAMARFARYLHYRIVDDPDPQPVVRLAVSKQSIARLLNLTGPSLSRTFRSMVDDELLAGSGRQVRVLDRRRLAALAGFPD